MVSGQDWQPGGTLLTPRLPTSKSNSQLPTFPTCNSQRADGPGHRSRWRPGGLVAWIHIHLWPPVQLLLAGTGSSASAGTSPLVRRKINPLKEVIDVPGTGSVFRALSKIAEAAHGLNVSGAVIDEVHVHKSRDLIDAIEPTRIEAA